MSDFLSLATFVATNVVIISLAEALHRVWAHLNEIEEHRAAERMRLDMASRFSTNLAHELNQPISAASTYLSVARRLSQIPLEQRSASLEGTLDNAAVQMRRAGEIINNVREFVASGDPDIVLRVCTI